MFRKLFDRPKCDTCWRGLPSSPWSYYSRGYNNLCQQAAGGAGRWCYHCRKVTFEESLSAWTASQPAWITPYTNKD